MTENRYDSTASYVPALREPEVIRLPNPQPLVPADVSAAWQSPGNRSRDSTSAQDRAKGFLWRQVPVYVIVVAASVAVTLIYALVAMVTGVSAPWLIDRFLVFLVAIAAMGLYAHNRADKRDQEYSVAGVERHRITTAGEIRKAEIAAELELRTAALDASLKLLETKDD